MQSTQILIAMFCGIGVAQGIFMVLFLAGKEHKAALSNKLLAGLLIAVSLRVSKSVYYYLIPDPPLVFIGFGLAGKLAIGPFLWFYLQNILREKYTWKQQYLLHFIPAAIAAIGAGFSNLAMLSLGYFAGTMWLLPYLILAWREFYQQHRTSPYCHTSWLKTVLGGMSFVWLTFLFQFLSPNVGMYTIGTICASVVFYVMFYKIITNPHVLQKAVAAKVKSKKVTPNAINKLIPKLEQAFGEEKIYHDSGLTLSKLSEHLTTPTYIISKAINSHYGKSFRELVNSYRIEEVKNKLNENTEFVKIESLAYDVGFNSPSAFYTAFKKATSLTPQEYRKSVQIS